MTESNSTIAAGDVAKTLIAQSTVLDKTEDDTKAQEAIAAKDEVREAKEQAAIAAEVKKVSHIKAAVKPSTKVAQPPRMERAVISVQKYLEAYRDAEIGAIAKADALAKLVGIVYKFPRKDVLDTIYDFFCKYKDAEFLQPINALQRIESASTKTINLQIRILYETMRRLSTGKATKPKDLAIEVIRNVFSSDDFATWCRNMIAKLGRGFKK